MASMSPLCFRHLSPMPPPVVVEGVSTYVRAANLRAEGDKIKQSWAGGVLASLRSCIVSLEPRRQLLARRSRAPLSQAPQHFPALPWLGTDEAWNSSLLHIAARTAAAKPASQAGKPPPQPQFPARPLCGAPLPSN
ncbi:unnamed protein product [Pleuronectes platessa]|uniref:Uncharacterized protein n=1 Tax=Pleuronectes platessa TaxID=8262 RepID=A0A9N7YI92_PLEPL|nr:unnamed protein product [Pleuronectes platessa]